jgi:hypothetical protein
VRRSINTEAGFDQFCVVNGVVNGGGELLSRSPVELPEAVQMRNVARFALSIGAAMLFVGCGGSQPPIGALNPVDDISRSASHDRVFHYTGEAQSFKVPAGVTHITIKASGASGPSQGGSSCFFTGGSGGIVKATISVTPGETLAILVGGEGTGDSPNCTPGSAGGFNGGGAGGSENYCLNGTGGGGASDVREGGDELRNRVIVAGGGGGGGIAIQPTGFYAGDGGDGGGNVGANGTGVTGGGYGGGGGTQHRGGKGGAAGGPSMRNSKGHGGKLGVGGVGGNGQLAGCGGGGGGGYYGGGGGGGADGASAAGGGGGGGGSSYIEPGATNTMNQRGAAAPGNGLIVISW